MNALSRKRDFTEAKFHQRQLQSRSIEVIEDEVEVPITFAGKFLAEIECLEYT